MGAEKDAKKQQGLELKQLQASILEADTAEYNEMEAKKLVDKRARNVEHRLLLEQKIGEKNARRAFAMSESEIKMNRQLLELVDKTLKEKEDSVAEGVGGSSDCRRNKPGYSRDPQLLLSPMPVYDPSFIVFLAFAFTRSLTLCSIDLLLTY